MTDYPYEGEVQLLGYAWNPDDGPWIRIRLDEIAEMSGGPHPFNGFPKGREKGQRMKMRFDLIADDETSTSAAAEPQDEQTASEPTPQPPERLKGGALSKRAGMLIRESGMQAFSAGLRFDTLMNVEPPSRPLTDSEDICRRRICAHCNVKNFRELDHPQFAPAGHIFDLVVSEYYASQWGETDAQVQEQIEAGRR